MSMAMPMPTAIPASSPVAAGLEPWTALKHGHPSSGETSRQRGTDVVVGTIGGATAAMPSSGDQVIGYFRKIFV